MTSRSHVKFGKCDAYEHTRQQAQDALRVNEWTIWKKNKAYVAICEQISASAATAAKRKLPVADTNGSLGWTLTSPNASSMPWYGSVS